jgi:tetratricopeptide (TPR) repeat protein
MLFDVKGRRKRFIQVTYVILALLFGVGLVGFGIGGGTQGGFFDALTGGGGGSSGSDLYEKQAERAQRAVRANPKREEAWLALAEAKINVARTGDNYDSQTGQFKEEASTTLTDATRAWERYLALDPRKPSATVASLMVQAYATLLRFGKIASALDAFEQAANAQEIVAEARPSPIAYFNLAAISYQIGKIARGDRAGAEAVRRTPKDQRNTVRAQLADARKDGLKVKRQVKKAEEQATDAARKARKSGQDPFGAAPGGQATPGGQTLPGQ